MTGKLKSLSKAKKVLLGTGASLVLLTALGAAAGPPEKEINVQPASAVKSETTKVEVKNVDEVAAIPYQTINQDDPTLLSGQTSIATAGVNGEKITTYAVTYTNGIETGRKQIGEHTSKDPVNEVKKVGTKVAAPKPKSNCDPNYSGACVPIASDVDCASGSGNGPAYVSGPVYVTGTDVYDLDRDGNGVGCE